MPYIGIFFIKCLDSPIFEYKNDLFLNSNGRIFVYPKVRNKTMSLIRIIQNKCPKCYKGQVFNTKNLLSFKPAVMQESCTHCHHTFNKEPGFYWGAMYVSYGLATLEMAIVYAICLALGANAVDVKNLVISILTVLVLFPFNFRMARLIWLYLFTSVIKS